MSKLTSFRDSLFDLISGIGTAKDPTTRAQWNLRLLNRNEVEHAYRSDWVARKIVDMPAEDATREWRSWQTDPDGIQAIEACEELHALQRKLRQALIRARLYGGAALVFAVKGQDPAEELDMESVGKGGLEFVVVMNRYELMAGPRIFNVESPYYTRPEYYTVATPVFGFFGEQGMAYQGQRPLDGPYAQAPDPRPSAPKDVNRQVTPATGMVQVHPSRVIEFSGNELPDWRLVPMGGGWGDSVLQTVDDVLKDIGLVIGGIANMVNDAKVDIIRVPDFSKQIATTEYANRLLARFAYANQAKSTVNSLLLDTNEEWQRVQSNFGGLPNILHEYLQIAGGAAGIPMSILVGQSGSRGMGESASGSSGGQSGGTADVRNYYDRIMADQENKYGPAMAALDQVLVRSALGKWNPQITYNWNPLYQDDASTLAANEVAKQNAMKLLVESGLINEDVLRQVQVNMLTDNEEFWIGVEDAVEEYGAEPEEPDIQVPWSRLAGAMAQLGGGGASGGPSNGGGGNGNNPNGGNNGGNGGRGGGAKPDILGALGAKLAPPKLPNMRVTSDAFDPDQPRDDHGRWWHGSASGELTKSTTGIHLGTHEAAKQALEARIGVPADGRGWTGDKSYGETVLAGTDTLARLDPKGNNRTGFQAGSDHPKNDFLAKDYLAAHPEKSPKFSDGTKVPLSAKPSMQSYRIVGHMNNTPARPYDDFKANGYMAGALKRGNAKNGYFYKNEGEDAGSISAVVPNARHLAKDAAAKVTKDSVNYRPAGKYSERKCGTCDMFEPPISCSHVEGHIHRPDTCDDYESAGGKAADGGLDLIERPEALFDYLEEKIDAADTRSFQLIRHGATSLNNDDVSVDRIRGWTDVPLSKDGRTEAHKIGRQMAKDSPPDRIYTSDLKRCADTAHIIAKHCNVPKHSITETQGLRPWDLGKFAGKTTKDVMPEITTLASENSDKPAPGGESFDSFKYRFFKGLHDSLNEQNNGHKVAIVTHHRGERLLNGWKKAGFPADGSIDLDEFNRKGDPTGHAANFSVPMDRLKKAAQ